MVGINTTHYRCLLQDKMRAYILLLLLSSCVCQKDQVCFDQYCVHRADVCELAVNWLYATQSAICNDTCQVTTPDPLPWNGQQLDRHLRNIEGSRLLPNQRVHGFRYSPPTCSWVKDYVPQFTHQTPLYVVFGQKVVLASYIASMFQSPLINISLESYYEDMRVNGCILQGQSFLDLEEICVKVLGPFDLKNLLYQESVRYETYVNTTLIFREMLYGQPNNLKSRQVTVIVQRVSNRSDVTYVRSLNTFENNASDNNDALAVMKYVGNNGTVGHLYFNRNCTLRFNSDSEISCMYEHVDKYIKAAFWGENNIIIKGRDRPLQMYTYERENSTLLSCYLERNNTLVNEILNDLFVIYRYNSNSTATQRFHRDLTINTNQMDTNFHWMYRNSSIPKLDPATSMLNFLYNDLWLIINGFACFVSSVLCVVLIAYTYAVYRWYRKQNDQGEVFALYMKSSNE